jgi:YbbR domain-containing protein
VANKFTDIFVNNLGLKVTAILLALMCFYGIREATSKERVYEVPVEVEVEADRKIAVLDKDPPTVRISVRGSFEDLQAFAVDLSPVKAVVHAEAADPASGEQVPIRPRDIVGVSGVRVVSVEPGAVNLTFDHEIKRDIRVAKPEMVGLPLIGKAELSYTPKKVTVWGPKSALEKQQFVSTKAVDVTGRAATFTTHVPVLSPHGTGVSRVEPDEITVKVEIVTEAVTRQFTNATIRAVLDPKSKSTVRFEPEIVTVSLHGRAEIVNKVSENSVRVFVDCADLDTSATYELPVNVLLPPGVDAAARANPKMVKVSFEGR